jgi:hypothetical protein
MLLCEPGSPIDQSAYDLKLKAPTEQKEILFMSEQRFGELRPSRSCFALRQPLVICHYSLLLGHSLCQVTRRIVDFKKSSGFQAIRKHSEAAP